MGKIPQGILGGVSGKVGGVVGTSWKGINVIKTKPLSVANPRTSGQVAQRTKFGNVTSFGSRILAEIIKPNWDRFASRQSGYNAFVSQNIEHFEDALPSADGAMLITKGVMETENFSIDTAVHGSPDVVINWTSNVGPKFRAGNDLADEVAINRASGEIVVIGGEATRDDETSTFTFSENLAHGDVIDVYVGFRRPDGTVVSNSTFQSFTVL